MSPLVPTPKPDKRRALCLACSTEFDVDDSVFACPGCGDEGVPADPTVRPEFKITWHELRCLVMWAEFWASSQNEVDKGKMQKVVYGIADRLQIQHMDGPPITFSQELAGLRAEYGNVEQNVIVEPSDGPKPVDQ